MSSTTTILDSFRALVGASTTWYNIFDHNLTNATAACYRFTVKPVPAAPYMVCHLDTVGAQMIASPSTFSRSATIFFRFEFARPSGEGITDLEDEFQSVSELAGDIMDDCLALSGTSGYMELRSFTWDKFSFGNYVESTRTWRFTGTATVDQGS